MIGHIKLDRKITEWEWYKDSNMFHVFVHLLLNANHKQGKFQGHLVKRGQLITGRLKLAADTGLSEMQIRTCLNKLKSTNEITINVTSKFSVITICKYDYYQSLKNYDNQQDNQQPIQQVTSDQPASNQQVTTNNNDNNNKNDNIPDYSRFWFLKYYHSGYSKYKEVYNGQSTTEVYFNEWKKFIDFIYDKKFDEVLECKFITPHDYAKLVVKEKFHEEQWEPVLKKLLSTGIKPEHNLYFRIPQFIKYNENENKQQSGRFAKGAGVENAIGKALQRTNDRRNT